VVDGNWGIHAIIKKNLFAGQATAWKATRPLASAQHMDTWRSPASSKMIIGLPPGPSWRGANATTPLQPLN